MALHIHGGFDLQQPCGRCVCGYDHFPVMDYVRRLIQQKKQRRDAFTWDFQTKMI